MPVVQMLGIIYYWPKKQDTAYIRRTNVHTHMCIIIRLRSRHSRNIRIGQKPPAPKTTMA